MNLNRINSKTKPLRILMFNRWVGYNQGGNETHIKELAFFLSRRGHKISILTSGSEALTDLEPYLDSVYQVSSAQSYFSFNNRFYSILLSMWFLVKSFLIISKLILIDKKKFDVLSVHFSLEAFLARFIRLIYGIPYILVLVGDTDFELIEGKYADVTIQISDYMADESIPFGYRPRVIPKGLDRKRFNLEISREERKKFIKSNGEKLVITVCRLDPRKNLETLVKAAYINCKKYPYIKYLIVGGGVEEKKLKDLIKKLDLVTTVYMYGPVSSTSKILPKLYRAADLFVLPTLYEGFGYVYAEAMACGLPIISTNTSAVVEVVSDVGILVPMKNPKKLAAAIVQVFTTEKLRKGMIKKGLNKVERWYWDKLILDYEVAYREAADSRQKISQRFINFLQSLSSLLLMLRSTIHFIFPSPQTAFGPSKSNR